MPLFPTSPTNLQIANVNGITYQYNTANATWTRIPGSISSLTVSGNIYSGNLGTSGTLSVGSVTGNLNPSANVAYSLGNTTNRWKDLWISNSTIYLGEVALATNGTALTINGSNVITGNAGSTFSTSGNITGGNILTTGTLSATGNVSVGGVTSLGNIGNVKITGGSANYVLTTDGAGNLTWTDSSVTVSTTSANASFYPVMANASSGSLATAFINTSNLTFNPSTGQLTVQDVNTLSDATLKENVEPIADPFTVLNQIFGMEFNWKNTGKKSYGVLAQAIEQVLPELVNSVNGKKTVNYIPIIAFLVEAVKKQQYDIEELKKINSSRS